MSFTGWRFESSLRIGSGLQENGVAFAGTGVSLQRTG
jgi:hypothetical protein